ncbi:AfsR/SARP family transcriptional regulator [Streptomyces sp. NBC_01318]|uniref:AfsR/SARP family transcriptional regulator n=1 Tax=Streptomyces sp. NBC_01318 TaxID=2903823 RepID=UPI002E166DCF
MEFQLLGPFEARHEGRPVLVGSRRQERCLLSILLLQAGHVVTIARLIDLLWNGAAPPSARGTVHTYIGRLRARLTPHGLYVETRHDGYAVDPGAHVIDAQEFLTLVRQAAVTGDPGERVRRYDQALGLSARCSPTWSTTSCATGSAAGWVSCACPLWSSGPRPSSPWGCTNGSWRI